MGSSERRSLTGGSLIRLFTDRPWKRLLPGIAPVSKPVPIKTSLISANSSCLSRGRRCFVVTRIARETLKAVVSEAVALSFATLAPLALAAICAILCISIHSQCWGAALGLLVLAWAEFATARVLLGLPQRVGRKLGTPAVQRDLASCFRLHKLQLSLCSEEPSLSRRRLHFEAKSATQLASRVPPWPSAFPRLAIGLTLIVVLSAIPSALSQWTAVSAGFGHTYAVTGTGVRTWGDNT